MRTAVKTRKMLHKGHYLPQKGKALIAKINRASSHITKDVDRYITKKPYPAMGIVMLAGICVGFLMHRH